MARIIQTESVPTAAERKAAKFLTPVAEKQEARDAAPYKPVSQEKELNVREYWLTDLGVVALDLALEKLTKVAKKLDMPGPKWLKHDSEIREYKFQRDKSDKFPQGFEKVSIKVWRVTVHGIAPKLAGWDFVATIQHEVGADGAAANIIRNMPGQEQYDLSSFRGREPVCDHCGYVRQRKDTYIVARDGGVELKQVGSRCLKDFLGHKNPGAIAAYVETMYAIEHEFSEEGQLRQMSQSGGGMRPDTYMQTEWYLAHVCCMIRQYGWKSRKMVQEGTGEIATSSEALQNMEDQKQQRTEKGRYTFEPPTAPDVKLAKEALEWVRTAFSPRPDNDYENNVKTACAREETNVRNAGTVASLIPLYKRTLQKAAERTIEKAAGAASEHIGVPGQKLELPVTLVRIYEHETQYGVTMIHTFRTRNNSKVVWFASGGRMIGGGPGAVAVGTEVTIECKVKSHGVDRDGSKQTIVTHVKLA